MSYIGQGLPADSFQGFTTDSFTGDGCATTFTLSKKPFDESALLVVINNVVQKPTTNFTVSGTTLTIVGTAVASGDVIYATHIGGALPIGQAVSVDLNGASDQLILDADADSTISADTDDQIDFKAGGTDIMSLTATTVTINDGTTIITNDNSDTLTLQSADADASEGPVMVFDRASSSPADDDVIGAINFRGKDSGGNGVDYVKIQAEIMQESDGSEDGQLQFNLQKAGTSRNILTLDRTTVTVNEDSQDIDFRVESDGSTHQLFVDAGNGRVGIGTSSPDYTLHVRSTGSPSNDTFIDIEGNATDSNVGIQFTDSGGNLQGRISYDTDDDNLQFLVNTSTERMRLTDATLMIGCTTATPGVSNTTDGLSINTNGRLFSNAAANSFSQFATDSDGNILSFASAGTGQGVISISGATTTYGAFTGTHWSRLADNSKPTILRGTLMESLDEMCDWYQAVADVAEVKYTAEDEEVKSGSKNVGDVKEPAYIKEFQ